MELLQRKPNRLREYDYSQNGACFVTICTKDRLAVLSNIVGNDAHIVPKAYGRIVEKYIRNVPEVEKYVIMPDHIHMIIRFENEQNRDTEQEVRCRNRVASIVRSIKTLTTKEIGIAIFQRSYYDHVIRNCHDYNETWEYIENNPRKWLMKQQNRG